MNFAGKNGFREMHKMYSPVGCSTRPPANDSVHGAILFPRLLMRSRHVFLLIPPRGGVGVRAGLGFQKSGKCREK